MFAHLGRKVAGHGIDAVGQILPCPGHAAYFCLTAELALGADLARHAGHFSRKGAELIDHGVDGVFYFENLSANVHCDLSR